MSSLLSAFITSFFDLFSPKFWGYVLRTIFMTIGAMIITIIMAVLITLSIVSAITLSDLTTNPYMSATVTYLHNWGIVEYIYGSLWGIFIGVLFLGLVFLFPVFLTVIVGMHSDDIALSLEKSHGYKQGTSASIYTGISSVIRLIVTLGVVNLMALPFYILFSFLAPILYITINGYFFGREYIEMVGCRHFDKKQIKVFRKENLIVILSMGMFFVIVINIPVLNFILPTIMIALATNYIGKIKQSY